MQYSVGDYFPEVGDIILEDSQKTGAKIVKFFMAAPTVWQYLWRAVWKTQQWVPYYHVAMISAINYNYTTTTRIIEQQTKVQEDDWNKNTVQIIFRRKNLTLADREKLLAIAVADMRKGWDVLNAFGKFLTWLTGIPLFGMFIQWPGQEICVNRVAAWYEKAFGEKFGALTHSEVTTQTMYRYLILSNNYTIVYQYVAWPLEK